MTNKRNYNSRYIWKRIELLKQYKSSETNGYNMNFTESQWIRGTYSQYTDPTECTEFVVLCKRCQGELEEYEMNNDMGECNECIEEQEEEGSYKD